MTTTDYLSKPYANENQFTANTFRWINANYPAIRHFFFHIPNEQATSDLMRMKMAGMGVLPGVPDFCFMLPSVWYLELKMPAGKLSPKQTQLHNLWRNAGISVHTAWSPKEVVEICQKILI